MSGFLCNIDAEAVLLGKLLMDERAADRIADLIDEHDFYEPVHQRIFTTALSLIGQGKKATAVTLKPYFDHDDGLEAMGGVRYLMDLTCDLTAAVIDPAVMADQLRELSRRRRMLAGLETAAKACGDLDVPLAEIVAHVDSAFSDTKDTVHQVSAAQCFDELLDGIRDKVPGVMSTTIPSLDGVLGPLRPKQLVIGAGRPGMGKTAMALSYALGAAMGGHGVLFVSLEMSSEELGARMAADLCFNGERGVPFAAITKGDLTDSQMRQVAEAQSYVRGLPFQVIDAGSLTTGRLAMLVRRHARRMAANGDKLELVIVDYLQLLSPDSRGRSNYEAVSEVSRALKALAKDAGVAVFALAQLSREVEKRQDRLPQLSDLRDSGQIEQDADAVMFLRRPEYYVRQEEPDKGSADWLDWEQQLVAVQGQIEFIVAKRRNGVTGKATGEFHGAYQAVRK